MRHYTVLALIIGILGSGSVLAQRLVQQGPKLVRADLVNGGDFGAAVALSADGDTANRGRTAR